MRGARIILSESDSDMQSIEFISGGSVKASSSCGVREMNPVRAVAIDGTIETISEIDRLLTIALDQVPTLIMCRGLTDDVRTTLQKNCDLHKINVSVLEFHLDLETVNALGDVAAMLGIGISDNMTITSVMYADVSARKAAVSDRIVTIQSVSDVALQRRDRAASQLRDSADHINSIIAEDRATSLGGVVHVRFRTSALSHLRMRETERILITLDDAARHGVVETSDGELHPAGAYDLAAGFFDRE